MSPAGSSDFALVATVFQASVLIYAHFAANNQSLRLVLGRLGEYNESSWAINLTLIGTIGVVMGMLICAFIIEHSTQENNIMLITPEIVFMLCGYKSQLPSPIKPLTLMRSSAKNHGK